MKRETPLHGRSLLFFCFWASVSRAKLLAAGNLTDLGFVHGVRAPVLGVAVRDCVQFLYIPRGATRTTLPETAVLPDLPSAGKRDPREAPVSAGAGGI